MTKGKGLDPTPTFDYNIPAPTRQHGGKWFDIVVALRNEPVGTSVLFPRIADTSSIRRAMAHLGGRAVFKTRTTSKGVRLWKIAEPPA